jgi:hypothetical protein
VLLRCPFERSTSSSGYLDGWRDVKQARNTFGGEYLRGLVNTIGGIGVVLGVEGRSARVLCASRWLP